LFSIAGRARGFKWFDELFLPGRVEQEKRSATLVVADEIFSIKKRSCFPSQAARAASNGSMNYFLPGRVEQEKNVPPLLSSPMRFLSNRVVTALQKRMPS
jgi:hypothetical protein